MTLSGSVMFHPAPALAKYGCSKALPVWTSVKSKSSPAGSTSRSALVRFSRHPDTASTMTVNVVVSMAYPLAMW